MGINDFGQHSFITWTEEDLRKEREEEKEIENEHKDARESE